MSLQTLDFPRASLAEGPKIMRYWYFSEGKVAGPLDAPSMKGTQSFSMTMLVCPEDKSGTNADDWKPAAEFPDFSAKASAPSSTPMASAATAMASKEIADKIENLQAELAEIRKTVEETLKTSESRLNLSIKELQENLNRQGEGVNRIQESFSSQTGELTALKRNLGTLAEAMARQAAPPAAPVAAAIPKNESAAHPLKIPAPAKTSEVKKETNGTRKKIFIAAGVALVAAIAAGAFMKMKPSSSARLIPADLGTDAPIDESAALFSEPPPPLPPIENPAAESPEGLQELQEIESFNPTEQAPKIKEEIKEAPKAAIKKKKITKKTTAIKKISKAAPAASASEGSTVISSEDTQIPIESLPGMAPKSETNDEKMPEDEFPATP